MMEEGNGLSVLDTLVLIWEGRHRPGFLPFIGQPDVKILWGFVLGLETAALRIGQKEIDYFQFRNWLRDVKQEFPPEGWHEKFLREAQGDHLAACLRFLGRVVEFRGMA
ncbi:hypothetical protein [Stigmatella erecta]|uniref:hypothetical protein n=1 Tax=Stigmatella erecta TaxID=83460 RepID=UPI000B80BBDE|nr:hypothetical protein [Stigmatella erecta]